MKVMVIFGTRPEAIKMAPLVKELEKHKEIETIVCVTAQHRGMLDQVLKYFDIIPEYDLDIMQQNQTITYITSSILEKLDGVIKHEKPDIVLVHGDTTTSFVAALAAFYNKIKVGHVEAGLRTYKKYSPYPEEINRVLVGDLADLHFSPTKLNKKNLLKENICEQNIFITGNTVIDAIKMTANNEYEFSDEELKKIKFVEGKRYILLTAHRRENLGEPLKNICKAVNEITKKHKDIEVIYPVHLNPKVQQVAEEYLLQNEQVHLIKPLDVINMHNLINKSYIIMTDSGGIQEEAPALGKPVLVLRNDTERPEAIETGVAKLVGTDKGKIIKAIEKLLNNNEEYEKMARAINPYGDGQASKRIIQAIKYTFNKEESKPDEFL